MHHWLEQTEKGLLIRLWIQPKASKTKVVGLYGEPPRLKIQIAAPPVDGEANQELLKFLKKRLRVSSFELGLLRGETSRNKDVLCTAKILLPLNEIERMLIDS